MASDQNPSFLLHVASPAGPVTFLLTRPIIVGRDEGTDLRLAQPEISRRHCRLEPREEGVRVTDLASSLGTKVDGVEVSQVLATEGATVQLPGQVTILVASAAASGAKLEDFAAGDEVLEAPTPARGPAPKAAASGADSPPSAPRPEEPARVVAARGRSARQTRSSKPLVFALAAAAVLAVGLGLALGGGTDPAAQAASALAQARAEAEAGELDAAIAQAESVALRFPETASGREAGGLAALWTERSAAALRLEEALAGLEQRVDRSLWPTLAKRFDALAEQHAETPGHTAIEEARAAAKARRQALAAQRLETVKQELRALTRRGRWSEAYDLLEPVVEREATEGLNDQALRELGRELAFEADQAYRELLASVEKLPVASARARLEEAADAFRGLDEESDLRARALLAGSQRRAPVPVEGPAVPAGSPKAAPQPETMDLLAAVSQAEALAAGAEWGEAADRLSEAVAAGGFEAPELARAEARIARWQAMARARAALMRSFAQTPRNFRKLEVQGGRLGRVVAITQQQVEIGIAANARVRWSWTRIKPELVGELLSRARLRPAERIDGVEWLLAIGQKERALGVLAEQWVLAPGLHRRMSPLVAEARDFEAIPAGGFVAYEGVLLTASERDTAARNAEWARLEAELLAASGEAFASHLQRFEQALGGEGGERVLAVLVARHERLEAQLLQHPALAGKALEGFRALSWRELEARRATALALIMNTTEYPYPYAPNGDEIQARVDGLVDKVAELWERNGQRLAASIPELQRSLAACEATAKAHAERVGELTGAETLVGRAQAALDAKAGLSGWKGDAVAKRRIEAAAAVLAHNEAIGEDAIGAGEREAHQATNSYRILMGRDPVAIAPKLVLAARGHSAEMKERGYFAHSSPVPGRKSPSDRARLAGWGGGVSENIARGQRRGAGAVLAWRGSSGHHRNILGARWTHLGCGQDADFWTQNFGAGAKIQ